MVMRNRNDGANAHGWWDDLPPSLKKRFANMPRPGPDEDEAPLRRAADGDATPYRPGVVGDLSRLAALFLVVALANVLFLLLALAFLFGGGPLVH